jgi:hypothetical protein
MRKERREFGKKLDTYLTKTWGPGADRIAKEDLNSKPSAYVGKWVFFAAALCKVMSEVPTLSSKAMEYVPIDLVDID